MIPFISVREILITGYTSSQYGSVCVLCTHLTRTAFGEVVHQPVKYDLFCREPTLLCSLAKVIGCLWVNLLSYICLLVKGSFSNIQGVLFNYAVEGG